MTQRSQSQKVKILQMISKGQLYKFYGLLVIVFITVLMMLQMSREEKKEVSSQKYFETHQTRFYEEPLFLPAVKKVSKSKDNFPVIKGGVIPHHLLPVDMLARFFYKISTQNPKRILLIGPNHPEKGDKLITTDWGWETVFGVIPPDEEMVNLFKQIGVSIDHEIVEHEHSVAGIMSFIKYFVPESTVATLILSNTLTLSELNQIADKIVAISDSEHIIIAPIDFSHYLISREAEQKDKVTWEAITNYDYRTILSMNNDYLDGRTSLVLQLLIMEKLGYTKIDLYENTNSGKLMNDLYSPTTSYYAFGFSK